MRFPASVSYKRLVIWTRPQYRSFLNSTIRAMYLRTGLHTYCAPVAPLMKRACLIARVLAAAKNYRSTRTRMLVAPQAFPLPTHFKGGDTWQAQQLPSVLHCEYFENSLVHVTQYPNLAWEAWDFVIRIYHRIFVLPLTRPSIPAEA